MWLLLALALLSGASFAQPLEAYHNISVELGPSGLAHATDRITIYNLVDSPVVPWAGNFSISAPAFFLGGGGGAPLRVSGARLYGARGIDFSVSGTVVSYVIDERIPPRGSMELTLVFDAQGLASRGLLLTSGTAPSIGGSIPVSGSEVRVKIPEGRFLLYQVGFSEASGGILYGSPAGALSYEYSSASWKLFFAFLAAVFWLAVIAFSFYPGRDAKP